MALIAQMQETFDQYWADADQFEQYEHGNEAHRRRLARALSPDAPRFERGSADRDRTEGLSKADA
jgi:hypothetical protein